MPAARRALPLVIVSLAIACSAPLAHAIDPKDVVEASGIIQRISKYSAELTALSPTTSLTAPTPRRDSKGAFLCPYKADGTLTEWANNAILATAGGVAGKVAGEKAGDAAVGALASKIPGAALFGGFLKKQVKETAAETGAKLALGGEEQMSATSDLSFDTAEALAVYMQAKHASVDTNFAQALAATFSAYPVLRDGYEAAIKNAYLTGGGAKANPNPNPAEGAPAVGVTSTPPPPAS